MAEQLYFAYGFNMSRVQMGERCPTAKLLGIGRLYRHRLVFNRKGTHRAGAVASIEKRSRPGEVVYGVVWNMSEAELSKLDQIENPEAYERHTLPVEFEDGNMLDCHVYVAYPQENPPDPDPEYLEILIKAAEDINLPADYVEELRGFRRS